MTWFIWYWYSHVSLTVTVSHTRHFARFFHFRVSSVHDDSTTCLFDKSNKDTESIPLVAVTLDDKTYSTEEISLPTIHKRVQLLDPTPDPYSTSPNLRNRKRTMSITPPPQISHSRRTSSTTPQYSTLHPSTLPRTHTHSRRTSHVSLINTRSQTFPRSTSTQSLTNAPQPCITAFETWLSLLTTTLEQGMLHSHPVNIPKSKRKQSIETLSTTFRKSMTKVTGVFENVVGVVVEKGVGGKVRPSPEPGSVEGSAT
ncbi:hypothetical protein HK097_003796, partial [Rhizophlyctis rosea]